MPTIYHRAPRDARGEVNYSVARQCERTGQLRGDLLKLFRRVYQKSPWGIRGNSLGNYLITILITRDLLVQCNAFLTPTFGTFGFKRWSSKVGVD